MMHGRNNGKKLMAVRIVKHAFEIIHLLTGENPLQVKKQRVLYVYLVIFIIQYFGQNLYLPHLCTYMYVLNQAYKIDIYV